MDIQYTDLGQVRLDLVNWIPQLTECSGLGFGKRKSSKRSDEAYKAPNFNLNHARLREFINYNLNILVRILPNQRENED